MASDEQAVTSRTSNLYEVTKEWGVRRSVLNEYEKWCRVSLRVLGDELDLEEADRLLQLEGAKTYEKGAHVQDNPLYARHSTNIWSWKLTEDTNIELEEQLRLLLPILEQRAEALRKTLSATGSRGELFIGYGSGNGQGGARLEPQLLSRVAALNLCMAFDLYPPDVDEKSPE